MNIPIVEMPERYDPIDFDRWVDEMCKPDFFGKNMTKQEMEDAENEAIARCFFLEQHDRKEGDMLEDSHGQYVNSENEDGSFTRIYFKFND